MAGPVFGGPGVTGSLRGQATNILNLAAGQVAYIPAGKWYLECGPYTTYQEYDIITGIWRSIGNDTRASRWVNSDGANFRVANQTGCVIGALLTNKGSGYTSVPTVVDATTGAIYLAILGPVVNTSVTVTNGGTGYAYPPVVTFSAPPQPGVQATGHCTLTSGVVTSVTVDDQGAGYTVTPTITFTNDPREGLNGVSIGQNASATATTTGAGTIGAIVVLDHGNPVTSIPTITVSGGGGASGAATCIMCWTITAYTVTTSGTGYTGVVEVTGLGGFPATAAAYVNPGIQANLLRSRRASILAALATTFANITATGQTVYDGGIYPGVPSLLAVANSPITTAAALVAAVGGANDTYRLFPA